MTSLKYEYFDPFRHFGCCIHCIHLFQTARAQYVEGQQTLRAELEEKRFEKEGAQLVRDMFWNVPLGCESRAVRHIRCYVLTSWHGVQAPALVNFWLENLKVQVEARSGALHLDQAREYCASDKNHY